MSLRSEILYIYTVPRFEVVTNAQLPIAKQVPSARRYAYLHQKPKAQTLKDQQRRKEKPLLRRNKKLSDDVSVSGAVAAES